MSLADIIEAAEANPTHLRICSPGEPPDLTDRFGARNVVVEHTSLPGADEGFVVVRRDGEFVGSTPLGVLETLSHPPGGTADAGTAEAERQFRTLLGLLDDTVFTSLERAQMLATSREFEDRAWRLGHGRLYTGFQSLPVMRGEADVYRRLATKPDLAVELFAAPGGETPSVEGATVRRSDDAEIADTWFVVYDADTRENSCALLAVERAPDRYHGFWTYDPDRVDEVVLAIRRVTQRAEP